MLTRRTILSGASLMALPLVSRTARATGRGAYRGRVVTEWLSDNRRMRLLEPFEYLAADGRRWPVPAGAVVDGASIPQIFWSVIGGPFEGPYRNASVVHDHYCVVRTRKHHDVHLVFYEGMLTSGAGEGRARMMYEAVKRFGPSWTDPKIDPRCEVVDEHFDFERCAKNWKRPTLRQRKPSRDELLKFAAEFEGTADKTDIAKLRRAIESQ